MNGELFTSTLEAKVLNEQYRRSRNDERPHTALDYYTPAAICEACRGSLEEHAAEAVYKAGL